MTLGVCGIDASVCLLLCGVEATSTGPRAMPRNWSLAADHRSSHSHQQYCHQHQLMNPYHHGASQDHHNTRSSLQKLTGPLSGAFLYISLLICARATINSDRHRRTLKQLQTLRTSRSRSSSTSSTTLSLSPPCSLGVRAFDFEASD